MSSRRRKASIIEPVRGGYIPLPWDVTDSSAYILLSHKAKALLVDLARMHNGSKGNNGHLHAGLATMKKRGWKSNSTLTSALRELCDHRLIQETRKGGLNAGASLYAITWTSLTNSKDIDLPANQFDLEGYRLWEPPTKEKSRKTFNATVARKRGTKTLPSYGAVEAKTAPSYGTDSTSNGHETASREKRTIPIWGNGFTANHLHRSTVTCTAPLDGDKEYVAIPYINSNAHEKTQKERAAFWVGYLGYWASKETRAETRSPAIR